MSELDINKVIVRDVLLLLQQGDWWCINYGENYMDKNGELLMMVFINLV